MTDATEVQQEIAAWYDRRGHILELYDCMLVHNSKEATWWLTVDNDKFCNVGWFCVAGHKELCGYVTESSSSSKRELFTLLCRYHGADLGEQIYRKYMALAAMLRR